jgi:hypothetical protein
MYWSRGRPPWCRPALFRPLGANRGYLIGRKSESQFSERQLHSRDQQIAKRPARKAQCDDPDGPHLSRCGPTRRPQLRRPRVRVPWQAPLQPLRRPLQRDRGRSRVRVPSVGVYVLLIDTSCFTGVYLFLLFLYSYTAEMS